jgi:hypothetical protein
LTFKNFSLQFLWEFVKQEGKQTLFNAGRDSNPLAVVLTDEKYQDYSQSFAASTAFNRVIDTNFPVEDASFIRLKTLSLSYNLPDSFIKKIGFDKVGFFLHGQNLFTLTTFEGLDPEENISGAGFQNLRSITGGVQLNL